MSRDRLRLALFAAGFNHGFHLFQFDSVHQMLKAADLLARPAALRFVPALDRLIQELAGLPRQTRQHRRQIHDQLPEQVQRDRANLLQLGGTGRVLAQRPRLRDHRRICSPDRPAAMIDRMALL